MDENALFPHLPNSPPLSLSHPQSASLSSRTAIVVVSQDLDELLELCDRIAVLNEGRLSEAMDVKGISIERVGLLMGGLHGETQPDAEAA